MDYFEGAENLSTRTSAYLNKEIRMEYKEAEVYDYLAKEYRTIKVIIKIL